LGKGFNLQKSNPKQDGFSPGSIQLLGNAHQNREYKNCEIGYIIWGNNKIQAKAIAKKPGVTWNLSIPGAFNPREMCIRTEKKQIHKVGRGIQRSKSSEELNDSGKYNS